MNLGRTDFWDVLRFFFLFLFFFLAQSYKATGSGLRGKPSEAWRSFPRVLILSLKVFPCLCFVLAAACSLLCPGMRGAAPFSRQGVKTQLCVFVVVVVVGSWSKPQPQLSAHNIWLPHRGWGA